MIYQHTLGFLAISGALCLAGCGRTQSDAAASTDETSASSSGELGVKGAGCSDPKGCNDTALPPDPSNQPAAGELGVKGAGCADPKGCNDTTPVIVPPKK